MGKKTYLTRDAILNADDLRTVEVDVPEWGGTVVVRAMNGRERDAFEESVLLYRGGTTSVRLANIRAKLCAASIINPDTKELLFSEADIEALGRKSAAALDRVFAAAKSLSKIGAEDVDSLVGN